jgi:glycosyl transferase family 25
MEPPIYYINLDRTPVRAIHMEAALSKLGLQALRVPAVDGRDLDEATCRALNPIHPKNELHSPGEIGCWLSHREIWERIANGGQAFGVVFEDDIVLSNDAAQFLSDLSWVPSGVDFVKLDTSPVPVDLSPPRALPNTDRTLRIAKSMMVSTAGYLLSKRCARQLLERTTEFQSFVDLQLFDPKFNTFGRMQVWQLFPAICSQQGPGDNFTDLPNDVVKSDLAAARKARDATRHKEGEIRRAESAAQPKMKFGPAKIWRELKRPLVKHRLLPRDLRKRFWWRTTCKPVPFRR